MKRMIPKFKGEPNLGLGTGKDIFAKCEEEGGIDLISGVNCMVWKVNSNHWRINVERPARFGNWKLNCKKNLTCSHVTFFENTFTAPYFFPCFDCPDPEGLVRCGYGQ